MTRTRTPVSPEHVPAGFMGILVSSQAPLKVAGYARKSTEDPEGQVPSIEDQVSGIKATCESRNWELVKVYQDDGPIGTIFNRTQLRQMVANAEKGDFQLVLTTNFDRIAFNDADIAYIRKELALFGTLVAETSAPDVDFGVLTQEVNAKVETGMVEAGLLDPMSNLWLLGGFLLAVGIWLFIAVLAVFQSLTFFSFTVSTEFMILGIGLVFETVLISSLRLARR